MNAFKRRGFTLIELLIVIAILGTLAVVVLLALNPAQQLARTRDAGRATAVTQLGHAIEAWATNNSGAYPNTAGTAPLNCAAATWINSCLVLMGEIGSVPAAIPYTAGGGNCAIAGGNGNQQNGFCYETNGTQAIIFAQAEATANRSKCGAGLTAHFVYSTADSRGGLVCNANPNAGPQTFVP